MGYRVWPTESQTPQIFQTGFKLDSGCNLLIVFIWLLFSFKQNTYIITHKQGKNSQEYCFILYSWELELVGFSYHLELYILDVRATLHFTYSLQKMLFREKSTNILSCNLFMPLTPIRMSVPKTVSIYDTSLFSFCLRDWNRNL